MDEGNAVGWKGVAFGWDFAQLTADDEDAVGGFEEFVGGTRVAAEEAERELVVARPWLPLPDSVWATGMRCVRASWESSSCARERWTPPPARMTGRAARARSSAARSVSSRAGRVRREGACFVVSSTQKSVVV